jgi:hypothetical protein
VGRTVQQRLQPESFSNEQCSDALRSVKLVTGDREQVDTERFHIDENLPDRLGGIGVENNASLATKMGNLIDGLNRSHFIVGMHNGDKNRFRSDRAANVIRIDPTKSIDGNRSDVGAESFNEPAWFEHSRVLDLAGYDMGPPT